MGKIMYFASKKTVRMYTSPRPLEDIEADIRAIEQDILRMLGEGTGTGGKDPNLTAGDIWSRFFVIKKSALAGNCRHFVR
jgi:hypothetical protein